MQGACIKNHDGKINILLYMVWKLTYETIELYIFVIV